MLYAFREDSSVNLIKNVKYENKQKTFNFVEKSLNEAFIISHHFLKRPNVHIWHDSYADKTDQLFNESDEIHLSHFPFRRKLLERMLSTQDCSGCISWRAFRRQHHLYDSLNDVQ